MEIHCVFNAIRIACTVVIIACAFITWHRGKKNRDIENKRRRTIHE